MEGTILESPEEVAEQVGQLEEAPSVFSVINRYLVGAADVSEPADDGSRMLRLYSASNQAIVEVALSSQLCTFIAGKLTEVPIIEQGDEDADDSADQG